MRIHIIVLFCLLVLVGHEAQAAARKITVSGLRAYNGSRLVAVSSLGQSAAVTIRSGKASITPASSKVHLYIVKNGEVVAVFGAERPSSAGSSRIRATTRIATVFKAAANIVAASARRGVILAQGLSSSAYNNG